MFLQQSFDINPVFENVQQLTQFRQYTNQTNVLTMLTEYAFVVDLLDDKYYDNSMQLVLTFAISGWNDHESMLQGPNLTLGHLQTRSSVQVFQIFQNKFGPLACGIDATV